MSRIPTTFSQGTGRTNILKPIFPFLILLVTAIATGCGVYSFTSASIPPEIKTVKLSLIENKARYVNPQLAPRLTDKLQQKIVGQTRLTRVTDDDADWVITGYVSDYSVTTSGISNQQASTNRLTVAAHFKLRDNKTQKDSDFDVSKSFEYNATLTLQQAETELSDQIITGMTDEIFNRLFSNW